MSPGAVVQAEQTRHFLFLIVPPTTLPLIGIKFGVLFYMKRTPGFSLHFTSTIINVEIPEESRLDSCCQDEALLCLDTDSGESPYWSGQNLSMAARDDCLGAFSL